MPSYAILISPRAEGAYFAQAEHVARAELAGLTPAEVEGLSVGDMRFLRLDCDADLLPALARLSFAQGLFEVGDRSWQPVDQGTGFALHPDFVYGEKFRGKTNETLTQLLVNLCLQQMPDRAPEDLTLLDPMCGRGTTLLWAMRYGIRSVGVEQDKAAPIDMRRFLKKWCKLHRQKHKLSEGWIQKANKRGTGKLLEFAAEGTALRVVTGATADAFDLIQRKRVDMIATDLPYGVQHQGPDQRSVIEVLREAAPGWARCLAPGGAAAIAFNANLPKRAEVLAAFEGTGLRAIETDLSHRMSESILRDVLLLRRE